MTIISLSHLFRGWHPAEACRGREQCCLQSIGGRSYSHLLQGRGSPAPTLLDQSMSNYFQDVCQRSDEDCRVHLCSSPSRQFSLSALNHILSIVSLLSPSRSQELKGRKSWRDERHCPRYFPDQERRPRLGSLYQSGRCPSPRPLGGVLDDSV